MSKVFLIESGITTQLKTHVNDKLDGHPLWGSQVLLTNIQAEIDTHCDFIKAGVDILVTNTYQASIEGFKLHFGLTDAESYNLIKKSVTSCTEAIKIEKQLNTIDKNKKMLIAGSVGSFGAYLADGSEYHGNYLNDYSIDDIEKWHRPRIEALIEGGVDIIAFETIPALKEAEILIKLMKEFENVKTWLSFSCKDEYHTSYGDKFKDAVIKLWSINPGQLLAIGANCITTDSATKLMASVKYEHIPTIAYPSIGELWDYEHKVWLKQVESEATSSLVKKWCEMGVKYIGACCGSSMETRKEMRIAIDDFNSKNTSSNNYE